MLDQLYGLVDPEMAERLRQRSLAGHGKAIVMDQGKTTADGRHLISFFCVLALPDKMPGVAECVARVEIGKETIKARPDLHGMGLTGIATSEPWQTD